MTRYSVRPRAEIFVKGNRFLSFPKNMDKKNIYIYIIYIYILYIYIYIYIVEHNKCSDMANFS